MKTVGFDTVSDSLLTEKRHPDLESLDERFDPNLPLLDGSAYTFVLVDKDETGAVDSVRYCRISKSGHKEISREGIMPYSPGCLVNRVV